MASLVFSNLARMPPAGTMPHLKLIGVPWSRTFRCIWFLEELGLPYELDPLLPGSPNGIKLNGTGKVPMLQAFSSKDESEPFLQINESCAINNYLATLVPNTPLVPPVNTPERAVYDALVFNILSELDASSLWMHRKYAVMHEFFGKVPGIEDVARREFERLHPPLMKRLKDQPYVMGEDFTNADILYIFSLEWAKTLGWHEGGGPKKDRDWPDYVLKYMDQCRSRPAYGRAREIRKAAGPMPGVPSKL